VNAALQPDDERAHEPGAAGGWWETWHLDAVTADGIGLSVRLACSPALGVARWWTYLVMPELPGPVVVRDHEVGLPRQGLEIRADGLWGELTCETPFEHWTYGLEAFGVRLDDPRDALRGEIGERLPVGLDIEWEVEPGAGGPHEHAVGWPVAGYTQPGAVRGEVLLGRSRIEVEAVGLRSHWWGASRGDEPATSAWVRLPELEASFTAIADGRADGWVRARAGSVRRVGSVRSETRRDRDGLPEAARYVLDDDLELEVEVLGLAPVPLTGAGTAGGTAGGTGGGVLMRALCRFDAGAVDEASGAAAGNGWASWLDPG
jgi:hypothetical protein